MSSAGDAVIGPGMRVTLHFSILLENGEEVDSTRQGKPATFEVGDGNLLPGFETALFGLRAGDNEELTLPADQAFGRRELQNVRRVARAQFPADMALEEGLVVSFGASGGGELPGVVTQFTPEWAEVDFNHPLAGRNVVFDVSIVRVELALST